MISDSGRKAQKKLEKVMSVSVDKGRERWRMDGLAFASEENCS